MNKRTFLKTGLLGLGGIMLLPSFLKFKKPNNEKFKLPDLKYNSLDPFLNASTIKDHFENHHKKYRENLKLIVEKYNLEDYNIIDILKNASKYPEEVRFNAGGYFNHNLYWNQFSTEKKNISPIFLNAIEKNFDSFEKFKQEFSNSALSLFGSGWTWLILKQDKTLKIINTSNNDNPLMDFITDKGKPLLVLDLWEHAYYNKYHNKKIDYINNFWDFVNWETISTKYKIFLNKKIYI